MAAKKKAPKKTRKAPKKAPKRNPPKKAPKKATKPRKVPKKAPKKAKRKNPEKPAVKFDIKGRAPKPETVAAEARTVLAFLKVYRPIMVGKNRAYYPWVVRYAQKLDIGPTTLLHALCYLAERGKVRLWVDEDHTTHMAPADRRLLPHLGTTDEPLVWVDVIR